MGNIIDITKPMGLRMMFGRRVIKTSVKDVDASNVLEVLERAMEKHDLNRSEIQYLWDYYRGKQPILNRIKEVRPEICNRIVENRANEIVSFKVGYLCGEPIQYVSRGGGSGTTDKVISLNDYMFCEDKSSKDQEIVEWQMICGTSYRMVLPNSSKTDSYSPFNLYTLDPRDSFVVYSSDIDKKRVMGVKYITDQDTGFKTFSVYTDKYYFLIEDGVIKEAKTHSLGMVPIFEYPANNARLGSFEIVLPLLDAINNIASNRLDGVEQTVQAFIKFVNCDITEEDFIKLKEMGAIKVKSIDGAEADVNVVKNDLNQDQSQTLKNDLYTSVLTICGIPNRNGGSSTSDTGAAVLLRDGWSLAEARAKDSENIFKKSEKEMLKLVIKLCKELEDIDIDLKDIDMKFTRRNYEAIQSKSQVLISMLAQPKIHPLLAFEHSGMFTDPESAYLKSMEYYEEQMKKWEPIEVDEEQEDEDEKDVQAAGQVSAEAKEENKARV